MSAQQFFNEVDAVVGILSEWVNENGGAFQHLSYAGTDDGSFGMHEEQFTAIWQAVELLSRAHAVLVPMIQLDMNKYALNIPDPQTEQPKQPKAARLYDGQGRPIA